MFGKIFSFPAVLRRHREGPLASERLEYLKYLNDRGLALGTVLKQARYCLCIAREIQRWPRDHCFNAAEIKAIAASWAEQRVAQGRAAALRWPSGFHKRDSPHHAKKGESLVPVDPGDGYFRSMAAYFTQVIPLCHECADSATYTRGVGPLDKTARDFGSLSVARNTGSGPGAWR